MPRRPLLRYGLAMRFVTSPLAITGAALVLACGALVGCASPPETPRPSPTASVTPLFDSDEEALAAAEAALEKYWAIANAVLRDGGTEPDRFSEIVTNERLQGEIVTARTISDEGRYQRGEITFDKIELQQRFMRGPNEVVIVTQCVDFSTRTLHETDDALVDLSHVPSRRLFQTLLVTADSRLLIDGTEAWPNSDC